MSPRVLGNAPTVMALAKRLAQSAGVTRFDEGEHREAQTLAYAFAELEESFHKFLEVHIPSLIRDQLDPPEMCDVLHEIGEEFRHILYHLRDPKFYRYLQEDGET